MHCNKIVSCGATVYSDSINTWYHETSMCTCIYNLIYRNKFIFLHRIQNGDKFERKICVF